MEDPIQRQLVYLLHQINKTLKWLTASILISAILIVLSLNPALTGLATILVLAAGSVFLFLYLMYVVFGGMGWGLGKLITKFRR